MTVCLLYLQHNAGGDGCQGRKSCSFNPWHPDTGSTNTLIEQIFAAIDGMIDGRLVCGAGGGGFLQVILKKGVTREMVHKRLKEVFQDNPVDVWECELV